MHFLVLDKNNEKIDFTFCFLSKPFGSDIITSFINMKPWYDVWNLTNDEPASIKHYFIPIIFFQTPAQHIFAIYFLYSQTCVIQQLVIYSFSSSLPIFPKFMFLFQIHLNHISLLVVLPKTKLCWTELAQQCKNQLNGYFSK